MLPMKKQFDEQIKDSKQDNLRPFSILREDLDQRALSEHNGYLHEKSPSIFSFLTILSYVFEVSSMKGFPENYASKGFL